MWQPAVAAVVFICFWPEIILAKRWESLPLSRCPNCTFEGAKCIRRMGTVNFPFCRCLYRQKIIECQSKILGLN
jgi:hypothetical protein